MAEVELYSRWSHHKCGVT